MQTVVTENLTSRSFVTAGNRGVTRYPNLVEMHNYYPCGEPAMCDHACIEPELLHAVLYNGESLEFSEILGLARLYCCPIGVLRNQEVIMLDMRKWRHRNMVDEVRKLYINLKRMAREGNKDAEEYLKWADCDQQRFMRAAHINRLSYCQYLGVKEHIQQYIYFSTPKPKKRGITTMKGGAVS